MVEATKMAGAGQKKEDMIPVRVGWIGTGVMGRAMAERLLDAGYQLTVFNRTPEKANSLVQRGAVWRESPAAVARESDVVFTMVGYPADVEQVVLGNQGLRKGWRDRPLPDPNFGPRVLIDMTTSSPELARRLEQELLPDGIASLDVPVSGGDVGARNGTLSLMAGGDENAFRFVRPLLARLGTNILWQGSAGRGQETKMVNQILIAGTMIGVCESLLYAERAGMDLERVLQSVSGGAAGSWSLSNLAPRILKNDYEPGFMVSHFVKDMGIALDEARRMNLNLPGLTLVKQLYDETAGSGDSRRGTQALIRTLRTMNQNRR